MKKSPKILAGLLIIFILIGAEASYIYHQSEMTNSETEEVKITGDFLLINLDPPKKPYSLQNLVIELQNVTVNKNDTDGDGLYDSVEAVLGTDFNNTDSDFDNLNDSYEVDLGLDPLDPDTNEDGLPDYHEVTNVYSLDIDGDGEQNIWDFDNDGDGVKDRLDLSPGAKSTSHSSINFSLTTDQNPLLLTFQVRPQDAENLKFIDQSWNWPLDNESRMQDLDNSTRDVVMVPWLRVSGNYLPNQSSVNDWGISITSDAMEVNLNANREHGTIAALTGRFFLPAPPASLSLEVELLWKVSGFSDCVVKSIEGQNGMYVTIGDNSMAIANTSVESEGRLKWVEMGGNNVSLQVVNGPYLSVADNGILVANGTSVGARETFEVTYESGNDAHFKAYNNQYLSVRPDGVIVANSTTTEVFTVNDMGYYPEVTPLVTYKDNFMITGLNIEESLGSDVGIFYSEDTNQTIAANLIMDYIFLRNATTTIWDMPAMLSSDYNVTIDNRTETYMEKNEAFVQAGNVLIPEILSGLSSNATLPFIVVNEDDCKTIDLSDIPSGSYIIGATNTINLTAAPMVITKSMKMFFYNISSQKKLIAMEMMAEIENWGLDENATHILMFLVWKWHIGQQMVTSIGGVPIDFSAFEPEWSIVNFTKEIVTTGISLAVDIFRETGGHIIKTRASRTAQELFDFLDDLVKRGWSISFKGKKLGEFNFKGMKQAQIIKSSKWMKFFKGLGKALVIIDVALSIVSWALSIKNAVDTAEAYREALDDAYGDEYLAISATITTIFYAILIALIIALFLSGVGIVLGIVLAILLAVFGVFLDRIIGAIVGWIMGDPEDFFHAEPGLDIEGSPESTILDYDNNGLDVGDQIEILTHLVGTITGAGEDPTLLGFNYIIPWISIPSPSDPYTVVSTRLNETYPDSPLDYLSSRLLNYTGVGIVNSTYKEDKFDSIAWIRPGIPMVNFPVNLILNGDYHIYSKYYHEILGIWDCWHSKYTDNSTTPFQLMTLYYDVMPGSLDDFISWGAIELNDRDGDGLNDSEELSQGVSDMNRYDTDADGLNDKFEIDHGILPNDCDTDEDGLIDKYEYVYGTNATNKDSDGDGIYDYLEIAGWIISFNYSGLPFQMRVFSNPALNDTDGDGYSDGAEYWSGLNPRSKDTNGDGVDDVAVPQVEIIGILQNSTDIAADIVNTSCTVTEFAVDGDGYVYFPAIIPGNNDTIGVLYSNLTYYNNWTLNFSSGIVGIDRANELLFIENESSAGNFWNFTLNGTNPNVDQLISPAAVPVGIAIDSNGFIYTTQTGAVTQISKFWPNGTYIEGYGSAGVNPEQFKKIGPIALDDTNGFIYVLDGDGVTSTQRVMKFNKTDGSFITTLPNGYGEMVDIAVDADGWVYILDQFDTELGEGCVRRFDHNGMEDRNFILTDINRTKPWELIHYPLRIDIDPNKNIYILENKTPNNPNPKLMKFRPNVTLIPPNITNDVYDWDGDGLWNLFEVVGWNTTFVNNESVTTLAVNSNPLMRDTDLDGLNDYYENLSMSNPRDTDTDGDGLSDFFEWELGTNLTDDDTDGDNLSDSIEVLFGSNPINSSDTDNDGLPDPLEYLLKSNPNSNDTDHDGANDSQEYYGNSYGNSSLLDPDTDDDFMLDGLEYLLNCDPNDKDTDDDGLMDGEELIYNTDPTNNDTDGEGAIDGLEVDLWLCPVDPDTDDDGLTDWEELFWGLNPLNNDTDADGVPDALDNDTLLMLTTTMYVSFDPDPYNNSLLFAQNLGLVGNVTIVSVDELLANHINASLIVLVGRPAPINGTVGGLIYNLLADSGTVLAEMMAPDSHKMVIRYGVWTSTQTVIMLSEAYPLDGFRVFSDIKARNITIGPNSFFVQYKTTPISHNTTHYVYGFQVDDIDAIKATDSIVSIQLEDWAIPSINITIYNESTISDSITRHNGLSVGSTALGKYLEITLTINGSTTETVESAYIQIYYRASDLDRDGDGVIGGPFDIDESTLAFYWYDETTGTWVKLTADLDWVLGVGVNTTDVVLYGESYAGFIWARVTHLSTYGVGGSSIGIPPFVFPLVLLLALVGVGVSMYILEYRRAQIAKERKKKKEKPKWKSKAPEKAQIGAVEEIEGIGPQYAKLLKQMNINTTEELRTISFVQIAEATDISTKLLYKWQCIADLFRVRRAAEEYTELLFEMGIHTVRALSEQDVDILHANVRAFAAKVSQKPSWRGKVKKVPTRRDVEAWIASAKELVSKQESEVKTVTTIEPPKPITKVKKVKPITKVETKKEVEEEEPKKLESIAPEKSQIGAIEEIEGIGPEYSTLLKQMNINTTEDLRTISFISIAEATDISTKLLYKWHCIADLFRVRRAAEEYTEFLFEMGIQTVRQLSEQRIDDLYKKVQNFAAEVALKPSWRGKVKKVPTRSDVEAWIASAKQLIKKGTK